MITVHEADNGSGVVLRREFCGRCGGGILEYGVSSFVRFSACLSCRLQCVRQGGWDLALVLNERSGTFEFLD